MSKVTLLYGDCIKQMKEIAGNSCNLICTDLPYGVTNRGSAAGKWDNVIPFEPMWEQFLRVTKENAAIILFASGMFTAKLMLSKPNLWRYNLIWQKNNPSGFMNANRMPLREHEDILVFYRKLPVFHPQMKSCSPNEMVHGRGKLGRPITNNIYGKRIELPSKQRCEKCPTSILKFNKPHFKGQHPTQKPVDLIRWLIRSYTNEGDVVLDATMGSGTTGVAAVMEKRSFIGIESDNQWFNVATTRIKRAETTPHQLDFFLPY